MIFSFIFLFLVNTHLFSKESIKNTSRDNSCLDYEIGKPKYFETIEYYDGNTLIFENHSRTVELNNENTYKITVTKNIKTRLKKIGGDKFFENNINACLKMASHFFRGPQNEKFEFVFKETNNPLNKDDKLKIIKAPKRPQHTRYSYNESCPIIIHEYFHLLGLEDLYKEENVYQCRSSVKDESKLLMADQSAFFEKYQNFQKNVGRIKTTSGEVHLITTKDLFNPHLESEYQQLCRLPENNCEFYPLNDDDVIVPITPGELRKILYPYCFDKNKTYLNCTRYTYYTEKSCDESIVNECMNESWLD